MRGIGAVACIGAAATAFQRPLRAALQRSTVPPFLHATRAGSGARSLPFAASSSRSSSSSDSSGSSGSGSSGNGSSGSSSSSSEAGSPPEEHSTGGSPAQLFPQHLLFLVAAVGPLAFCCQLGVLTLVAAAAALLPVLVAVAWARGVQRHTDHLEDRVQQARNKEKLTPKKLYDQQKHVFRENMWLVRDDFLLLLATGAAVVAKSLLSAEAALPLSTWVVAAILFGLQSAVRPIVAALRAACRAYDLCEYLAGGPRLIALARVVHRVSAQRAASPGSPPAPEGNQPGLQDGMQAQPIPDRLPTQHGDQDVLTLETYRGTNKFQGKASCQLKPAREAGFPCVHWEAPPLVCCCIGRSVALLLAKEGAKGIAIVHTPKEQKDAADAKKLIEKEGSEVLSIPCDFAEGEEVCKAIVDQVVGTYGKVDVLILNAAIQYVLPSIEDTTPEILEDTYRTSIFPIFYLTKHAVPHMPRGSSIVSSVTAYQGSNGLIEYSSTKGSTVAFTRSLSQQLAPRGIRVNAVAAGPIWTLSSPASREDENMEGFKAKEAPLGCIGQPIEAACSCIFLASQEASYVTGQVLYPNGGFVVNG